MKQTKPAPSTRLSPRLFLFSAIGALTFAACVVGEGEHEGAVEKVDQSVCASGLRWAGGNEESENMRPGLDCIGCHQSSREGPSYAAAGTVYVNLKALDDCFGVQGATVEITDANGTVHTTQTNEAGNFFFSTRRDAIATPYTARVGYNGRWAAMTTPQTITACNSCHTEQGANSATGRIVAP